MALTDKLKAIANAIRDKAGTSAKLTLAQMPTAIANIPTGGGSTPDYLRASWEVRYTSKVTSGRTSLVSQQQLVDAGIIPNTKTLLTDVWTDYTVELIALEGTITHSKYQTLWAYASDKRVIYTDANTGGYYRQVRYHGNSTTSVSAGHYTTNILSNYTGQLSHNTTDGIAYTCSTTYGIGVCTYKIIVSVSGRK